MIAQLDRPFLTPEQYLEAESRATQKHEYINGEIYAMAGGGQAHGLLITNLVALIRPHLRGSHCRLFASDMKVQIETHNSFYYPDLVVTCDERDRTRDQPYLNFPVLIIEVLSDSTESFDRGKKFLDYSQLPSLQEYILVSQHQQQIEVFHRQNSQQWLLTQYSNASEIKIESLALSCAIRDIYEDVIS
ncbi:MAG: Uma2 family endonuclease [Spirulinaceae cyanobacterium]